METTTTNSPFADALRADMATAKFEYNRHDKMYYYIDGCDFSIAPIEAAAEA